MEQIVPFTYGNSEETDPKLSIWKQIVPITARWDGDKLTIMEQIVSFNEGNLPIMKQIGL